MRILHCSAECYPYAKVGGLADVVGALPKYQNMLGHQASVVVPMHKTPFLFQHQWDVVYRGSIHLGYNTLSFTVIKEQSGELGFDLFAIDIHGLLDREKVYGYDDDLQRFIAFQLAIVQWVVAVKDLPQMIHVHDHHTAMIPFFLKHTGHGSRITSIKTVLTIHNAQYQGNMPWHQSDVLPHWDGWKTGLMEWNDQINSLACGIKCADKVNTVSHHYMHELRHHANGLEKLFEYEMGKCSGIINGIDYDVWNPMTDQLITTHFNESDVMQGKELNKKDLCAQFGFDEQLPLFIFIGRLVYDKGADLLSSFINAGFNKFGNNMNWLILGSGDRFLEDMLRGVAQHHSIHCKFVSEYNEPLSHQMYASADFLIMPSRVEPCGLNQLYALRYGTIPMVRRTGGLQDTVIDMGDEHGVGICFLHAKLEDMLHAMGRAMDLYHEKDMMEDLRKKMMKINNSWERSARDYIDLYNSI